MLVAAFFAVGGVGFTKLEQFVKKGVGPSERIRLLTPPLWMNDKLQAKVCAAVAHSRHLRPEEGAAASIQKNLSERVVWLDQVKVQVTNDQILIGAKWRKPVALVNVGAQKLYVDADLVVLDFVAMPNLPIVEVKGLPVVPRVPRPGEAWQREDLGAAVVILTKLERMDSVVARENPLLYEITSIDVSNFGGRKSNGSPHIVIYAKDNTKIIWGAEYGQWQRHLESTDKQKIAKLYQYYKEHGTLLSGVKYINLCDPQDDIPLPIDKD
jgi:hypothetical protein